MPQPNWLIGKNVTNISIAGITIDASGTITVASSSSLVGQLDEIQPNSHNTTEEINAMDRRAENEVIISSGSGLTLVEILKRSGNVLAPIGENYDHCQIVFTRGGRTHTGQYVIKDYNETMRKGKSVGQMTVGPIDNGGTNPTIS